MSLGFIKLVRSEEVDELLYHHPNAFKLLYCIATRARRRPGFNHHSLEPGQALIGDHDAIRMTRQEYRTAKATLEAAGFAAFNPTNSGTIATILNTKIFDINVEEEDNHHNGHQDSQPSNHQVNQRPTIEQPSPNHRPTTNEEGKKGKKVRRNPAQGAVEEEPSDHRLLIEVWHDAFKAHFEEGYKFTGGKDAKAVKDLLKFAGSPEAVMEVATAAWSNLGGFLLQQASTLHGLSEKWNEINVSMKAGLKSATKIRSNLRPAGKAEDFTGGDITEEIRGMQVG